MSACRLKELSGTAIEPWLDQISRLRIDLFRDFPYLYDGDFLYERNYLSRYLEAKDALILLVLDGLDRVMGVSTCLPMTQEEFVFQEPFLTSSMELSDVCYFGESLLEPHLRGKGLGHLFFDRREAHAQKIGCRITAFCAVEREQEHPMRPMKYQPLDGFWCKRGYTKREDLKIEFPWKEVGAEEETKQTMTYWLRDWS